MRLIRRVGVNYSLSSADLKELVDTMSYGQAAVDTVVMMFSRLRDPDGVDAVIDAFTYPEDKVAIRSKLGR